MTLSLSLGALLNQDEDDLYPFGLIAPQFSGVLIIAVEPSQRGK